MTTRTIRPARRRVPLTRERVLRVALELADAGGLESVSMRKLGHKLGVEGMALYHHFANKEALIDGMIDLVFAEIPLPATGADWRASMRQRAISARDVLSRHRWAIGLMESRRHPGPANLRHHDAVIASLRAAGFSLELVGHAYSMLDAYVYGFAMTHLNLPFETSEEVADVAQTMLAPFPAGAYPHLVELITGRALKPGYDYGDEFEYGLDVILDGLARVVSFSRSGVPG